MLESANEIVYKEKFDRTHTIAEAREVESGTTVKVAGRIVFRRIMGKFGFMQIRDLMAKIQVLTSGSSSLCLTLPFCFVCWALLSPPPCFPVLKFLGYFSYSLIGVNLLTLIWSLQNSDQSTLLMSSWFYVSCYEHEVETQAFAPSCND